METLEKLRLLADASQYDLACACGTDDRDRRHRGADGTWLYPVSLPRGGHSVMLKTLMSNVCVNDCKYCPYRQAVDVPRCTLGAEEVAAVFMGYVRRKQVMGLFLSSGVVGTPDRTMALLNDAARRVRTRHHYRGFIHIKVIPGASDAAIEDTLSLASAVSLNIETPGKSHFEQLSTRKQYLRDIVEPLKKISALTSRGNRFERVKTTTQFIVGASSETDRELVHCTAALYERLKLQRVYFSAYQQGLGDSDIPGERHPQTDSTAGFLREHRLYQVDFLFRQYRFAETDILFDAAGGLSLAQDPKQVWADAHPEAYPVDLNTADHRALLRVPGIGPVTARTILDRRRSGPIASLDHLPLKGKRRRLVGRYVTV